MTPVRTETLTGAQGEERFKREIQGGMGKVNTETDVERQSRAGGCGSIDKETDREGESRRQGEAETDRETDGCKKRQSESQEALKALKAVKRHTCLA